MKKIIVKLLAVLIAVLSINTGAFADFSFRDIELNFVQMSDTHISDREDTSYKVLSHSKELMEEAIKQTNDIKNLDFVIFTGDMVDMPQKNLYRDFFILASHLEYPMLTAFGNHDVAQAKSDIDPPLLTKQEALELIGKCNPYLNFGASYYAVSPKKNYRVIVLDTVPDDGAVTANGFLSSEQLEFLKNELEENKNKVILIFHHHPLVEPFKSEHHRITNRDDYMNILKEYKKTPIAVFSGHYHATKVIKQGNIIHVSTPSLVTYPNAFRYVSIANYKDRTIFNIKYIETGLKEVQNQSKLGAIASAALKGLPSDHDTQITIRKNRAYRNEEVQSKQKLPKEDRLLQKQMRKAQKQELKRQKAELKAKKKLEKMNAIQGINSGEADETLNEIELLRQE